MEKGHFPNFILVTEKKVTVGVLLSIFKYPYLYRQRLGLPGYSGNQETLCPVQSFQMVC